MGIGTGLGSTLRAPCVLSSSAGSVLLLKGPLHGALDLTLDNLLNGVAHLDKSFCGDLLRRDRVLHNLLDNLIDGNGRILSTSTDTSFLTVRSIEMGT